MRSVGTPVLAQASTSCASSWNKAIFIAFQSGGKLKGDA
jgi:hypothetical protein